MKRYIMLLAIFLVMLVLVFYYYGPPIKNNPLAPVMNYNPIFLNSVQEIPQNEEFIVAKPVSMLGYKSKVYILDLKFYCILVFNENGLSHTVGRHGAGPGEITDMTISFKILDDKIYILSQPNRIEILTLKGDYLDTIKLQHKEKYFFPTDLEIFDNNIFISISASETRVQQYDCSGRLIKQFIGGGKKVSQNRNNFLDPLALHIDREKQKIIIFSRFSGDIDVFDLKSRNLLWSRKNYDPIISRRIADLTKKQNQKNYKSHSKAFKSVSMWQHTVDQNRASLLLIPSQNSVNTNDRVSTVYLFDYETGELTRSEIIWGNFKQVFKYGCFVLDRLVIMDYSFNLFYGGYQ
jgi:hypothetical protein